jgi:hypothetical protein
VQLHRQQQEFSKRGAGLVIIGNGAPNFIGGFREHTGYQGPLYTDPSLSSYRALELTRSVFSSLNPKAVGRAFTALRQGFRQRKTQGDPWQQGGTLVVSADGEVVFLHRARYAGELADVSAILHALESGQGSEVL